MREEIADIAAALAARFELPSRSKQLASTLIEIPSLRIFNQLRLVIEGIDMRHPAGQVNKDDAFCSGSEMRFFRSKRIFITKDLRPPVSGEEMRKNRRHY